jgi:hypothetical protein
MPAAAFTTHDLLRAVHEHGQDGTNAVTTALGVHRATAWRAMSKAIAAELVVDMGDQDWRLGIPREALVQHVTQLAGMAEAGRGSIDDIVADLAALAVQLDDLDIDEAMRLALAAEVAGEVLKRCRRAIDEAERGRRAFEGFALQARVRVGRLLGDLDPGTRGANTVVSDRRKAADAVGLSRQDTARVVELAEIPAEKVEAIAAKLEADGKRLTVTGVLKAAASPDSTEGCSTDDYYTPPEFTHDVRIVFSDPYATEVDGEIGAIDSDPTSCLLAQCLSVKARSWSSLRSPHDEDERARALAAGVTEAEIDEAAKRWTAGGVKDGRLTQVVAGCVYANPPYSDPAPTINTIIEEHRAGRVREAIILVNTATSSAAQQELLRVSSAQLWIGKGDKHPRTRIAFVRPDGTPHKGNMYDQVAYYLGEDPSKFVEVMSGWGVVTSGAGERRRKRAAA